MSESNNEQRTLDHYHDLSFRRPGYAELVDVLLKMHIEIDNHPDTIDDTSDEKHAILVEIVTELVRVCRNEYMDICDNCDAFLLPIIVTENNTRRYWCKDCQLFQKYDQRGMRY